jgi:light-regulated signal transduction histidine kinase (bacteriophytochrome)
MEVTLKDNRELKETQDQLFENQDELRKKIIALNRSNYELEQFAHLASHDLQEPLRKIFFYSDTLKRKYGDTIDEGGFKILNSMTKAAGRMRDLINDLLSYSQLQNQKLVFEEVDLNILIHEIINDMEDRIKEKNSKVDTNVLFSIKGNPLRLRQLFVNLISNSLKYSKPDIPPHIQINALKDHEKVSIQVKDNGIGFDEKYREKIFGLFERLHTKDKIPGTGIGLSICKKIVELHHGTISAASQPGEYSIFDVTLPIAQEIDPATL